MGGVGTYTNGRRIGKRGWHFETKVETMHIIVCFLGGFVCCLFFFPPRQKSKSLLYKKEKDLIRKYF